MNEKRFEVLFYGDVINCVRDETGKEYNLHETIDILMKQQDTINKQQGDINRLQYIIEELRKDNYKQFEKINELQAQLREKEEDEKLYANEILELRETNKEHIKFKSLGGNY